MSKILSKAKSVGLNLALLFCICLSLLPLGAVAQVIDFSLKTIEEPIDIDFWKRHLQKGIEIDSSNGYLPHLILHRPINFAEATFYSRVNFWFAEFNSTADFSQTKFKDTGYFEWATFDSSVSFFGAEFDSTADFGYTRFKGSADFGGAAFDSSVSFSAASFHSGANFSGTDFKGRPDFSGATFDSSVGFFNAEFNSTADFWGTEFKNGAYFAETKFKGKADFGEARFGDDIIFSNAILPDTLDFTYVKDISKEIDFTLAQPPLSGGKCRIALVGAEISKIKLNMALFTLCFPTDTTFGKSSAGKDSIIGIYSTSYDGQLSVYESVLKKLKDDGFMESYQILDIDYRRFKYKHGGFFDRRILNTFQRWWWNYGYSKELVFLWAIGFWVLFSLVNLKVYPKLSESVYTIGFLEKIQESAYTGIKKWIFYALQVVSYTAIVFFGLKMDVAKFKKGVVREHPWLFVYLMMVYVVGLVCLGFIVNIIFTR
jgi:uncharacterized protein YjbI with pentapeptide repeats